MQSRQGSGLKSVWTLIKDLLYVGPLITFLLLSFFPELKPRSQLVTTWVLIGLFVVVTFVQYLRARAARAQGQPMPTPALLWQALFRALPVRTGAKLRERIEARFVILCDPDTKSDADRTKDLYTTRDIEVTV